MADITEAAMLFDKKMKCEVCGMDFTTKQVRTGKARFAGTSDTLKPLYTGIDSVKYDIVMCPHCGYAATMRNYGHLTAAKRQAIKDNVSIMFKQTWKDEDTYSYDVAIRRCKMAMLTEMVTAGKISESAYLCLKLAWLYEGQIDELETAGVPEGYIKMFRKSEKEYIESAYKGFKEAVATEYPPIAGMDENTINYLLSSLASRCGEETEARQFASSILGSRTASAQLKDKTRMILEKLKNQA